MFIVVLLFEKKIHHLNKNHFLMYSWRMERCVSDNDFDRDTKL